MDLNQWKSAIRSGALASHFSHLYGTDGVRQPKRYLRALDLFEEHFGQTGDISLASAGGRVEIIGNHTDHNNGRVLTAAISLDALCVARRNQSNTVRLFSDGYTGGFSIALSDLEPHDNEKGTTSALVRGIAHKLVESGYAIGGFDGYIASEVLRGSGLSSSAAVEALITQLFVSLYNDRPISGPENARISQYAERTYFGKPCGLMDQMACAVGGVMTIDFNNNARIRPVKADFGGDLILAVVDTLGNHADLTDEYASITREMHAVAEFFGHDLLVDVDENEFFSRLGELSRAVPGRAILRAYHFFEENKRVDRGAAALNAGDVEGFFSAVRESGESSWKYLQNLHAGSSAEQRVELALLTASEALGADGACRVHGGGFGGTILCFLRRAARERFISAVSSVFGSESIHFLSIRSEGSLTIRI
ncbi:MAG: galactokinase [Eubacteriales bacterium]|nr:galactokinase [Eubacteriales bacterium]